MGQKQGQEYNAKMPCSASLETPVPDHRDCRAEWTPCTAQVSGSQQQALQNELTHTQWQDRVDCNGGTKSSVFEIWTSGIISFKKCNLAWDVLQAFFFFLSSFHQTWLCLLYIYCAYQFQCFCFFRPCKPGMVTWERFLHLYRIHSWLQLKFTKHIPRLP